MSNINHTIEEFIAKLDRLILARIQLANTRPADHIKNFELVTKIKEEMRDFLIESENKSHL